MKFAIAAIILVVALVSLADAAGQPCKVRGVDQNAYTTWDGLVVSNVAYVITFKLSCSSGSNKDLSLIAALGGRSLPVVRSQDGLSYEVSWNAEVAKAPKGQFEVQIYEEEQAGAVRRAQASGTTPDVKPLTTLTLNHTGTYRGPLVQSEVLALLGALGLWYFTYSAKKQLTSK